MLKGCMHTISVRHAVEADIAALAPLFDAYRQFYGKRADLAGARAFLQARLSQSQSQLLIAHADGAPAGFTQLYPSFSSLGMAPVFVLNDLFVTPAARRRGVAEALLKGAAERARELGAIALTLSTATGNSSAQALYEGAGWQRDSAYYTYNLRLPA